MWIPRLVCFYRLFVHVRAPTWPYGDDQFPIFNDRRMSNQIILPRHIVDVDSGT
jgi:hypothetical protein